MSSTAHERYRKRLAALVTDEPIMSAIEGARGPHACWPPGRKLRRIYGRFNPDRELYASLVFEVEGEPQLLLHVEISESRTGAQGADDLVAFDSNLGWLRVMRFPADPALDTLGAVLAGAGRARVVRYRPQRRCTIRFDEAGRTRFVKVYPKKFLRRGRGEQLHADNLALWRASERGELDFAVAEPEHWDAQARALWQVKLDGTPAFNRLCGKEGAGLARRMGRAAASLTLSGIRPQRTFDAAEQLAASSRYGAKLCARVPRLAATVNSLLKALAEIHAANTQRALRPIHGDMDAHQWLDDKGRLGLVDFDDFALGDPELDVATFLAELEFEGNHPQLPFEQLAAAFVDGYALTAGTLDKRLLCAYLAHKRLFKALRSARALQPDGDVRAERCLALGRRGSERELSELLTEEMALV
jgi:hypothetical protein